MPNKQTTELTLQLPFFPIHLSCSKPFFQSRNLMQVAESGKVRIDGPDRHYFIPWPAKLKRVIQRGTLTSHWSCTAKLETLACTLGSVKDEETSPSSNECETSCDVHRVSRRCNTRFIIWLCVSPSLHHMSLRNRHSCSHAPTDSQIL